MKVIKYGPGHEPKTIICSKCHSEIEYINADIKWHFSKVKTKDNTYQMSLLDYLECPVCNSWIELSRTLEDILPATKQESKKRKWFSRKEN